MSQTRKIVLFMQMSLDGYMEGPGRSIDWHQVDDELHQYFNDELAAMGAFLSGRVTHELMADFWPYADEDPANAGPMAEFARIWREKPKFVFSRTLERADWNTTVVREVSVDEIESLKARFDGDLVLSGAHLAAEFLRLGLVDEYRVFVHPVLVGGGTPLFPSPPALTPLRLAESRTFGNGVVMLHHVRANKVFTLNH
ncbi:dihydrofolate reductase family protein [Streptomyces sp. HUAS MG47]|uniref:dihydrofolate reductase family protein n=1 Tax=Streptomyces solicamelliae TaxID=3231716 RepID=UPI0038781C70